MTHLPEEWAHRSFAERPTVEKKLTLAEIDKKIEELAKGLEELERTAAASKVRYTSIAQPRNCHNHFKHLDHATNQCSPTSPG